MATLGRWIVPAGLLMVFCCGCDTASIGSLIYFLGPEPKTDPELRRLAFDDKFKEASVVILVSTQGLETRPELIQSDRQLAECFAKTLRDLCADNNERIKIISPRKIEEFKSSHPNWESLATRDIGKHFQADYVIDVEINSISLYEKGTNMLFRGQIELRLALVDVNKPNENADRRDITLSFPSEAKGGEPVGFDTSAPQFRQKFLSYVGKRLAWNFTGHPPRENYYVE